MTVYEKILAKPMSDRTKLERELFVDALMELSHALDAVAWLTQDETYGEEFNQEILAGKLGHVFGESIDEMAYDVWCATEYIKED